MSAPIDAVEMHPHPPRHSLASLEFRETRKIPVQFYIRKAIDDIPPALQGTVDLYPITTDHMREVELSREEAPTSDENEGTPTPKKDLRRKSIKIKSCKTMPVENPKGLAYATLAKCAHTVYKECVADPDLWLPTEDVTIEQWEDQRPNDEEVLVTKTTGVFESVALDFLFMSPLWHSQLIEPPPKKDEERFDFHGVTWPTPMLPVAGVHNNVAQADFSQPYWVINHEALWSQLTVPWSATELR
ncbi:hypothetical protein CYMTET_55687, partial [Cymbomonas tetramitiformis]